MHWPVKRELYIFFNASLFWRVSKHTVDDQLDECILITKFVDDRRILQMLDDRRKTLDIRRFTTKIEGQISEKYNLKHVLIHSNKYM